MTDRTLINNRLASLVKQPGSGLRIFVSNSRDIGYKAEGIAVYINQDRGLPEIKGKGRSLHAALRNCFRS